jgi:predicted O-linked N-acetylglucosamine transferase (SPINDLY family)
MDRDPQWPIIYGKEHHFDPDIMDNDWLEAIDIKKKTPQIIADEYYLPITTVVHAVSSRYFDMGEVNNALDILTPYLSEHIDPFLHTLYLRCLLVHPQTTQKTLTDALTHWNQVHIDEQMIENKNDFSNLDKNPNKKLKIGILCSHTKSTLFQISFAPLFAAMNRNDFFLILFNLETIERQPFNAYFDLCINIPVYSDKALIQSLTQQNIDILLNINNRFFLDYPYRVLLKNLAPIQVSYGHSLFNDSLENIPYLMTDKYTLPHKETLHYKGIYRFKNNISRTFQLPPVEILPQPCLQHKEQLFIFASFNASFKLNDLVLDAWCQILQQLPNARLLLKGRHITSQRVQNRLIHFISRYQLDSRIIIECFSPVKELLSRYQIIDLALNPFPYSGTTTAYALWNGVPSLTLSPEKGTNIGGAKSILLESGLDFFIAKDIKEYCDKAVYCAKHPEKLEQIRKTIHQRISHSARFNPSEYGKDFESGLRSFWHDWLKKQGLKTK